MCVYVCLGVRMCACVYAPDFVCLSVRMCTYECVDLCVFTYVLAYMYGYVCLWVLHE